MYLEFLDDNPRFLKAFYSWKSANMRTAETRGGAFLRRDARKRAFDAGMWLERACQHMYDEGVDAAAFILGEGEVRQAFARYGASRRARKSPAKRSAP